VALVVQAGPAEAQVDQLALCIHFNRQAAVAVQTLLRTTAALLHIRHSQVDQVVVDQVSTAVMKERARQALPVTLLQQFLFKDMQAETEPTQ
jgi:hypothetical protein